MRVVLFVSSVIRGYGLRLPGFSKISTNRRANGGATEVATFDLTPENSSTSK